MTKPRRRSATPHPKCTLRWYPTGNTRPISTAESPASAVGEAAVAADGGGAASAVGEAAVAADGGTFHTCLSGIQRPVENLDQTYNSGRPALTVLPMPNSSEAFPCPLEGNGVENAANAEPQSDQEPAQSDEGTATVTEFQGGDSVYAKSQADLGDAETEGEKEEQRSERKPRDITPEQQVLESKWAGRNDADHVGNIGWLFGNWGKRPSNMKMRNHLDTVLKKQPAMVIGLAECQLETERVLKREPDPAAVAADPKPGRKRRFKNRPEFAYLTLRGKEEDSVLIAVRDQAGCALQHFHTERVRHGPTKEKTQKATKEATHTLAASSRRSPCRTKWVSSEDRTLPWWCTCTTCSPMVSGQTSSKPFGTGFGRRSNSSMCRS